MVVYAKIFSMYFVHQMFMRAKSKIQRSQGYSRAEVLGAQPQRCMRSQRQRRQASHAVCENERISLLVYLCARYYMRMRSSSYSVTPVYTEATYTSHDVVSQWNIIQYGGGYGNHRKLPGMRIKKYQELHSSRMLTTSLDIAIYDTSQIIVVLSIFSSEVQQIYLPGKHNYIVVHIL